MSEKLQITKLLWNLLLQLLRSAISELAEIVVSCMCS